MHGRFKDQKMNVMIQDKYGRKRLFKTRQSRVNKNS